MTIELRHLRYFIAVAEEGHITRAAERLGMQQPPLSQQIKALEGQLHTQLFRRKARGVELTDVGRTLAVEARAVLDHLDRALEPTRRTARGEQGAICIGTTPTVPFHPFVPRVIRAFRDAYPMVAITLEEALSANLLDHLRDERLDAVFIRSPVTDGGEGLFITPLLEEEMVLALPAGHALAQEDPDSMLQMRRLAAEIFILYGPAGSGFHDWTIAACRRAGFSPRVGQLTPSITSTLGLVAAGLGISFVPASMRRTNMDGVEYRGVRGAGEGKAVLRMASRKGETSAVVRQFVRLVRQAAAAFEDDTMRAATKRRNRL